MDIQSVLVVLITTLLAISAGLYTYALANLQDLKDNWVQYRCNPIYMPLAGMVGSDIATNFMNCMLQSSQSYAGVVLDPIYQNFSILTGTVNTIMNSMNDMRSAITGAADGFLGIIQNTFAKLHTTLQSTAMLFGRVRTLMNRMVASFAVLMNIINTGVQTGESVKNGPIGQAAEFFCFHPETPIFTTEGVLPIHAVRPGMKLADGQLVRSTLVFDSLGTKMYRIGTIQVSGNHKVKFEGKWIRVEDHPLAVESDPCERLICLNTENHTIPIGGFYFKDYEETSDPDILSEFFRRVENHYGFLHSREKNTNPTKYRYTGIFPSNHVILDDSSIVMAKEVQIGDLLKYGGEVEGIVHHRVEGMTTYKNVSISPGTWILNEHGVVPITEVKSGETYDYIQFITRQCHYAVASPTGEFVILDDHEVADDEIHTWRDNEIQKEV
jgi:hypothetical protein